MPWVSPGDLTAEGLRLFCLPHAGAGAAGFYQWKRLLPPSLAVCPVMLPGRERRLREPLLTGVDAIVDALQEDTHRTLSTRPFVLFGHSMGALLAFEWARRIVRDGLPPPAALIVSGRRAPDLPSAHRGLHLLPDRQFLDRLALLYGEPPGSLMGDPEMRELFLPILRADLQVVESYRFQASEPLPCPLLALAGTGDASVSPPALTGWQRMTTASFQQHRIPGGHFYHLGAGRADLLRILESFKGPGTS